MICMLIYRSDVHILCNYSLIFELLLTLVGKLVDWRSCLHTNDNLGFPSVTGAFFHVGTAVVLGSALIHHGGWRHSAADSNAARGSRCTLDGVRTTAKATDCTLGNGFSGHRSNKKQTNNKNMFWGGEDGLGTLADVTLLSKYPSLGQGHWKSRWCLGVRAGGCTAAAFKSSESSWTSGEQHGSS